MSKAQRFLEQIDPLRDSLTAYCRRLVWSSEDLEDSLQETLAVAYRSFGAESGDFRARLFRIATWTCFNLNRRHRRANDVVEPRDEEAVFETLERECTYEEILHDPRAAFENIGDELARACSRLHQKERAILLLKTLAGLTCAEIAEVMDVPLGTAQGLLTRARRKMREHLLDTARSSGLPTNRRAP